MQTLRGLDRLVTFLDAIVAISVTLLILPLVDIGTAAEAGTSLSSLFHEHAAEVGSFLLSFAVILRFWQNHHQIVEHMKNYDRTAVNLSFVWALTIVVLPFATSLLPQQDVAVTGFYIGTMLLSTVSLAALSWHVARTPAICNDDEHENPPIESTEGIVTTLLMAIALVVAVTVPGINYYALLVLFGSGVVTRYWKRRRAGRRSRQVPTAR